MQTNLTHLPLSIQPLSVGKKTGFWAASVCNVNIATGCLFPFPLTSVSNRLFLYFLSQSPLCEFLTALTDCHTVKPNSIS